MYVPLNGASSTVRLCSHFVDADPAGPHARTPPPPPSTPSLWAETIEAACNVEGGQTWLSGGTYMAGTMETLRGVGCLVGEDKALAFVMRSWANRRPHDPD